jgi:hypothetical protein
MDEAMQDPEEDRAKYKGKKNKTKGGGGGGKGSDMGKKKYSQNLFYPICQ